MLLLLAGLAWLAKKQISQPRIGVVKFGIKAKKKIKAANIILLVLVLATFVLLILSVNSLIDEPNWRYLPQWLSDFDIDVIFALIIVGIFCLIGYYTGTARFYLHGVLLGAGNFATTVLFAYSDVKFGWPIALAGLIVAGIGTSVLVKFLQTHLLPSEVTPDDQ
jgi:hypothetical protein